MQTHKRGNAETYLSFSSIHMQSSAGDYHWHMSCLKASRKKKASCCYIRLHFTDTRVCSWLLNFFCIHITADCMFCRREGKKFKNFVLSAVMIDTRKNEMRIAGPWHFSNYLLEIIIFCATYYTYFISF